MPRTALIIGATGLVGSELLQLLIKDNYYSEVTVFSRKMVLNTSEKVTQHIINFDKLEDYKEKLIANDIFCCLGTTMKNAGSKEAFYQVDFEYVYNLAKLTSVNGATTFNLISAMGADSKSSVFYNKVKGEIEEAVSKLKFRAINILRPSLIIGDRKESRPLEKTAQIMGKGLSFLFLGPLRKYRPIKATAIAKGILKAAKLPSEGIHIYSSDEIEKLAQGGITST
jgi:uncharacterized protein YbjT (DUF2867 family)